MACWWNLVLLFFLFQFKKSFLDIGPTSASSCCSVLQFYCHSEKEICRPSCETFLVQNGDREYVWRGSFCSGRKMYEGGRSIMPLPGVTPSPRESELSLLFDGTWKVINRTECEGSPDDWVQFLGKYSNAPLCPGYVSYWWYNTSVTPPTCWDIICKRATSTTSTTTTTTTTTFPFPSGENTFEWPPAATWCLIGLLLSCLCFAGYRWAQPPKSRDARLEARNETLFFLDPPRQGTNQYK